ncbi:MAG TPA: efflux RND transporter periplasmic adaptor subunit [Gemmatimonadales bacterium]|nr:efflux RND transporter periplasmic adaptor subunit [Gemmatimonadales bacterium]
MKRVAALRQIGTLLLCLTGALPACSGKAAEAADTAADSTAALPSSMSLPVVGREVRKGDLVLSVVTTGQVRSDAISDLKFEAAGTVAEVLVRPGQAVRKGDPLLRLDKRPFDLAVAEAQANADQAEMSYLDAIVPDSLVTGEAPTPERRRNALARSGLLGARARLGKAELDRERSVLTAPFDGVVDRVQVAAGERVSVGQEAVTVVDLTHLRVEAQVLEHDLPLIRVGGQAVVTTAAAPGREVIGRIEAVLPLIDTTTRSGRALVVVPGGNGMLRPGMYADLRLEATRLPSRILVPSAAVIERDGRPLVFVVKNGRAQWVYITPGRNNGVDTEVLPDSSTSQIPVAVGDTVLIEGHLTLTHDAPVKLVSDE